MTIDTGILSMQTERKKRVDIIASNLFYSGHPYNGKVIQFRNEFDRANLQDMRHHAVAGNDVYLIMEDNTTEVITPAEFITVTDTMFQYRSTVRQFARTLKNTIEQATTFEELYAIDVESGWPTL